MNTGVSYRRICEKGMQTKKRQLKFHSGKRYEKADAAQVHFGMTFHSFRVVMPDEVLFIFDADIKN